MKGNEVKLVTLLDGSKNRFIVPIYQRKYSWKIQNCRQLYSDLKRTIAENKSSHFFGSVVASVEAEGAITNYFIIDGQQRMTTTVLLLLSIVNLIKSKEIQENNRLVREITDRFLIDPYADEDDNLKLKLIKEDQEVYKKLIDNEKGDELSNLTVNYRYFYNSIKDDVNNNVIKIEELYESVARLEVICISLGKDDNPQRIFESLNSTGLALSEGDKIRNYVLMNQTPKEQTYLYKNYWSKIEECTKDNLTLFIRDYLSIKEQMTPNLDKVYFEFKDYVENNTIVIEDVLSEMKMYAELYQQLIMQKDKLELGYEWCIYRLNRLDVTVARPFFLEVLRLRKDKKLSDGEVKAIFSITETYLFRRNICDVPSNALNKIFVTLNKDIMKYDGTASHYVEKFKYTLLSKKDSGRFPNDVEFINAFSHKEVYQMRGKYKTYLFERLENYGTDETKDVYTHLDNNDYSIEHIMPQHLTPAWQKELGENYMQIHDEWLHRLANLTLTGYNPNLSNKSFLEKRDATSPVGYSASGLRMNLMIAKQSSWGLEQLEERNKELMERVKHIWSYPTTDYMPKEKEFNTITLEDDNAAAIGKKIVKYQYKNIVKSVTAWTDMFKDVVTYLYDEDSNVLRNLLCSGSDGRWEWNKIINTDKDALRFPFEITGGLYLETNNDTGLKLSVLRKLFDAYRIDYSNLIMYLNDEVTNDREQLASSIKKWVKSNDSIVLGKSSTTRIRFTTPYLTGLVGELDDETNGWKSKSVYFYEVYNDTGNDITIKLTFCGMNLKPEQRKLIERLIRICSPNKELPEDWQWKTLFKTKKYNLDTNMTDEEIGKQLCLALDEIKTFEHSLKEE